MLTMNWWDIFISQIGASFQQVQETAGLFWSGLVSQFSLIGLIDLALVAYLLWWLYRKLRRTELITIAPRIFILLIIALIARILGLWALFYLTGALLIIVLLAIAALYAPEIKHILSSDIRINLPATRISTPRVSTADSQTAIKTIIEALAVLARAHKPALFVIKRDKSLTRLIENGTKMNSPLRSDLLIDFFGNGSVFGKGAVIIEGNKIVAAGSTLMRPKARVLFNPTDPTIQRIAKDLNAVVVLTNRTTGDISVVCSDNTYKNLPLNDLSKLLQNILVYHRM